MKRIVVIDGQGGRLGQLVVEGIKQSNLEVEVFGIGTNTIATSAMLKAGADQAATGENPVVVACRDADIIIGPIGITVADALLGEITEKMAVAIGKSSALKRLLPVSHCNNHVVGVKSLSMSDVIRETIDELKKAIE